MEQNEAKVIVRRIRANKRKENRARTWEEVEGRGQRYHEDTRELTGPTWFNERDHVASNSIVKWPQDRNDVG